jgi:L-threonylcarbamoyladenylate synthase
VISYDAGAQGNPPVLSRHDPDVVSRAAALLRGGRVIVIPTDTVYGLAAAIDRPDAVARLYAMKARPLHKAIPVLVGTLSDVSRVAAALPPAARVLAARFWPGPLTLVLPSLAHLPTPLTSCDAHGGKTVAVRAPDHALAQRIIRAAGGAIAVTSANASGEPEAILAASAADFPGGVPDLIVDAGPSPIGIPSTVIELTASGFHVLRQGAISADDISAVLEASGEPFSPGAV